MDAPPDPGAWSSEFFRRSELDALLAAQEAAEAVEKERGEDEGVSERLADMAAAVEAEICGMHGLRGMEE
jgi:hypothetical protein